MSSSLKERAVLMRFTAGLPGQSRKDKKTTQEVVSEKHLGDDAGKWLAQLWPPGAMDALKGLVNEARAYHENVTLPFGGSDESDQPPGENDGEVKAGAGAIRGIGILPAALILEYGDQMRHFAGRLEKLTEDFLADPQKYVDWAVGQHNGTFNPRNYPGCSVDAGGKATVDGRVFGDAMRKKIYLRTEPLPVPDAEHFCATVATLLGTDMESVNLRVADAGKQAQIELLKRMIDPVQHMAARLVGQPCHCRNCKGRQTKGDGFKDSLVQNLADIAALGPKLNLSGDPAIDGFCQELEGLARYSPQRLREDKASRSEAAKKAAELVNRLSGYKL